jgi:choloylglycine hydrolase
MDWLDDTDTTLWAMPRGTERSGGCTGATPQWKAKYGSVAALMYDSVTIDGINEEGFNAAGLYLAETDYGERDEQRPGLMLTVVLQYFLDNFATVAEAVQWAVESNFQLVPIEISGEPGTGHLMFADASGDSAILEFIDGKLSVHHGPQFRVGANSPTYDEQLEILKRYEGFGGSEPLPGSIESSDRFVRASRYVRQLPPTDDERLAIAEVLSVVRNASAPFGSDVAEHPNLSATRWRCVSDLSNLAFYFESTTAPNIVWVDLQEIDFDELARPVRFDPAEHPWVAGDVTDLLAQVEA